MRNNKQVWKIWLFLLALMTAKPVAAQLTADFTMDRQAGCSPLTVSFTNATTGASAAATYSWDFGNSRTAISRDAGSIFSDEKTYTVTLTVTDGGQTAVKTKTVIVYKKPAVDFSFQPTRGCSPLTVNFTSSSVANDGATITSYAWDYKDGTVANGANITNPQHQYTGAQTPGVSLTVTDSHGCLAVVSKPGLTVLQAAVASFIPDKTTVCNSGDQVTFTNKSTGGGTLTYQWDFGDGTSSTDAAPVHAYTAKGTFIPKLTVTSSEGCTGKYELATGVSVANFTADFSAPAPVCTGNNISFTANTTPVPDYTSWTYSDAGSGNPRKFTNAGDYDVTMVAYFGTCQVSTTKKIKVLAAPAVLSYTAQSNGACGAPATIVFSDTSKTGIKWQWNIDNVDVATTKSASYLFNNNGNHAVTLVVTDAVGCSTTLKSTYYLAKPTVYIYYSASTSPSGNAGCEGMTMDFASISTEKLTSFQWDFGDGGTATDAAPKHTFNKAGVYNVTLNYVTESGCKGKEVYTYVAIYKKPGADFTMKESNPICGNTPVHFDATVATAADNWYWFYEGDYKKTSYGQAGVYQYTKPGTYTVILIAANGMCRDTVVKNMLVTVVPPFPKISTITNTCNGDRTLVTFKDTSRLVNGYTWDFGDGSAPLSYATPPASITHTYPGTGVYKVVLTGTNGACSVRDSMNAFVYVKQHPVLSILADTVCGSDSLPVRITTQEAQPYGIMPEGDFTPKWQYAPGAYATGIKEPEVYDWSMVYNGYIVWLTPGIDSLRAITTSTNFNCLDTTDFVKVHIKGPTAAFTIAKNGVCYNTPNVFTDISTGFGNIGLKSWTWDFGDSTTLLSYNTQRSQVEYIYGKPGTYKVNLKVVDEEGCYDTAVARIASVTGPKADFSWAPDLVKPGTAVAFTNETNLYGINSASYQWTFSYDNSSATTTNPVKKYNNLGTDTVMLIASNPASNCRDTVIKYVRIKNIQAAFTYTATYSNGNSCPPLVASFVNQSVNSTDVTWNFGDGETAGNVNTPSHSYTKPGKYTVTIYAYDGTGDVDSVSKVIEVKGPVGSFTADHAQVCGVPATITFTAKTEGTSSFTWDLADGTLINTPEYVVTHTYTQPGAYKPAIILKDDKGCQATFELAVPFVIDTLSIAFDKAPAVVCDSGLVQFTPRVTNIGASQWQLPLYYHWNFGTGQMADTANTATPAFYFNKNGSYTVKLTVQSTAGCIKDTTGVVMVKSKTHGTITGPDAICKQTTAAFAGTADGVVDSWNWKLAEGVLQSGVVNVSHTYNTAGVYQVLLMVTHDDCIDTTVHVLQVNDLPVVGLTPSHTAVLCLGDSIQLGAQNGVSYSWTPANAISSTTSASPKVSPAAATTYVVTVTDVNGCVNADSIKIRVAFPFTVQLTDSSVCNGSSITLPATGAATYQWIAGSNISNSKVANPAITPSATNTYTVVGYDSDHCFTDTASAVVTVYELPQVATIADTTILAGSTVTLQTTGSSNTVKYRWSPPSYLDCPGCQSPISTPRQSMQYVVTALTGHNCIAKDTVHISLLCEQSSVFIPNTFTPNKDNRNDVFYPRGKGIRMVKYFRIYNRLGEMVFERVNFNVNDASQGWDGSFAGNAISNNVFNYVAEMICDGGDTFLYKGTVLLVH
ncbi:gliding motility-associated C-terminal domain-containing protein [Filimonas lacunae]|uniref:Gliding motility-associated C-terminal domain-containing protein n=1 Tax=Filimonas lacunae TaxID=477680 RepID=A0A173MRR5_9BACT|nr:PKD domain-containing protein [Filimonas lacunae]BAV10342.1 internalin [Filimonas lacunae]SIT16875.1 gliding motility-associated C-terminal domain-containing protein [Filimonas lacunae]